MNTKIKELVDKLNTANSPSIPISAIVDKTVPIATQYQAQSIATGLNKILQTAIAIVAMIIIDKYSIITSLLPL